MKMKDCEYQMNRRCYSVECTEECRVAVQGFSRMGEEQAWETWKKIHTIMAEHPRPIDRKILGLRQI